MMWLYSCVRYRFRTDNKFQNLHLTTQYLYILCTEHAHILCNSLITSNDAHPYQIQAIMMHIQLQIVTITCYEYPDTIHCNSQKDRLQQHTHISSDSATDPNDTTHYLLHLHHLHQLQPHGHIIKELKT